MEALTTELVDIALTVLGLLLAAAVSWVTPKINGAIKKLKDKDDTGLLGELAEQAVELVEARFLESDGDEKFEEALSMLSDRLTSKGIEMESDSIRMAIQKGWRLMNEKQTKDDEDYTEDDELDDEAEEALEELIEEENEKEDE